MNYIDFDDCRSVEIMHNCGDLILMRDKNKTPSMLYFATDNFESVIRTVSEIPGKLRIHFVPREHAPQLKSLGFTEWGDYVDFWNDNLINTAASFIGAENSELLTNDECSEASEVSHKCRLQSRGFEGETPEWFAEWLVNNKVIVLRNNSTIAGYCCVSIYNEGTTLWVRELAVDPAYQGTGLGKKLMEQAICYGIKNGAVKGFLAADILNENAIDLYKKYGFNAKDVDGELQMIRE